MNLVLPETAKKRRELVRRYLTGAATSMGMSLSGMAKSLGLAPSTFNRVMKTDFPGEVSLKSLKAVELACGIELPPGLIDLYALADNEPKPSKPTSQSVISPANDAEVPVFVMERDDAGAERLLPDPVQFVKLPAADLAKGMFAFHMPHHDLSPAAPMGSLLYVARNQAPRPGDLTFIEYMNGTAAVGRLAGFMNAEAVFDMALGTGQTSSRVIPRNTIRYMARVAFIRF